MQVANEVLEVQLDRLADLLARKGMTAFFANPVLTPEPRWFPDRWTPDFASVRRLLLRFADYAGLEGLGVEVGVLPRGAPAGTEGRHWRHEPVAAFMGITDGTAHFAARTEALSDPVLLTGVLAHEMAHVWRTSMGLRVEDPALEEKLTDLTTVVLGWGILTSNAAYQVLQSGESSKARFGPRWSERGVGYLPVEVMSALLAVHVTARGEDPRHVRRHLGVTQVDAFDQARRWLSTVDLDTRLALPTEAERPVPTLAAARALEFPPSRASTALHQLVIEVVARVGEDGGLLAAPLPFPIFPVEEAHTRLATWGRADADGGWLRWLWLVKDPEWTTAVLVLTCEAGGTNIDHAIGHVQDAVSTRKKSLEPALAPLFDPASPHAKLLLPALPGFVRADTSDVLGSSELERLFTRALGGIEMGTLAAEVRRMKSFAQRVRARIAAESQRASRPDGAERPESVAAEWWRFACDDAQARAESEMIDRESSEPASGEAKE